MPSREITRLRRIAAREYAEAERLTLEAQEALARGRLAEVHAEDLEKLGVHGRVQSDRNGREEQASDAPKRRGPPLKSTGPVARAARNAGISMREIARRLGVPYTTVASWDSRGHIADDAARKALSKPPYTAE